MVLDVLSGYFRKFSNFLIASDANPFQIPFHTAEASTYAAQNANAVGRMYGFTASENGTHSSDPSSYSEYWGSSLWILYKRMATDAITTKKTVPQNNSITNCVLNMATFR